MDDVIRIFAWYVALAIAGMLGLPLASRYLGTLPDRGLTFARPVGLLAIATAYGLVAMTGIVPTGLTGAILAVAIVALGSAASLIGGSSRSLLKDALRVHARSLWLAEAIFVAAFLAGVLVRAHHPDIMATGKPEEFTLFNGLLRSQVWPPLDPWLSGRTLAQPYFGWVFIAFLTAITGVPSAVAFNLAVATVSALSVNGVYAVVLNMLAGRREAAAPVQERLGPGAPVGPGSLWLAAMAPVVIVVAGNLYGVLAILHANGALADLTIVAPRITDRPAVEWVTQDVWTWLDTQGLAGPPPSAPERLTLDPGFWWWYEAGRVVNDSRVGDSPSTPNATTAFPAWAFVLGDLEPQVLGLPWALLALGVALAGTRLDHGPSRTGLPIAWLMAATAGFGALSSVSLWWAPIVGGLIVLAPLVGRAARVGWRRASAHSGRDLALGLAPIPLGLAAYAPFLVTLAAPDWRLAPNLEDPTRLQQSVVAYFPILWLMVWFFTGLVSLEGFTIRWRRAALVAGAATLGIAGFGCAIAIVSGANPTQVAGSTLAGDLTAAKSIGLGALALRRLLDGWTTLLPALGVGLCVAGVIVSPRGTASGAARDDGAHGARVPALALLLVAAACAAFLLPEWIYWQDEFGSRSNTLAQLSFQAWILGGIGAWVGVCGLAEHRWRSRRGSSEARRQRLMLTTGSVVTMVVVVLGLIYTGLAIRSIATTDPASLDGMAYLARTYPDDWAATAWLSTHAEPNAVLVEAIGGDDWAAGTFSRVSMITGLPGVLGWPGHEARWRAGGAGDLAQREADVARLYVTNEPAEVAEVLRRYDVSYVIVGSLEQSAYDIPADAAILTRSCGCLEVAFSQGSLTILRVVSADLP